MVMARWCGMRVERFSIFFGPVLAKFRRGETTYQIAAIPLGGYVQIAGMNPHEQLPPEDQGSFENKPVGARFLTILAGPATNYICAVLVAALLFMGWGAPDVIATTGVNAVVEGKPAAVAGMKPGDRIVRIGDKETATSEEVRKAVETSGGKEVLVEVERAGTRKQLKMAPRPKPTGGYEIGVAFEVEHKWAPLPMGQAMLTAVQIPAKVAWGILTSLGRIISGQEKAEVGGPVAIVGELKKSFQLGVPDALWAMILLNVMLCIFNLLPIPALDGGRLAFLGYTAITRRRVNPRVEAVVHTVGFVLLLGLFLLVTYSDLAKLSRR